MSTAIIDTILLLGFSSYLPSIILLQFKKISIDQRQPWHLFQPFTHKAKVETVNLRRDSHLLFEKGKKGEREDRQLDKHKLKKVAVGFH